MIYGLSELFIQGGIIDLTNVQSMNKNSLNLLILYDELTTKEATVCFTSRAYAYFSRAYVV